MPERDSAVAAATLRRNHLRRKYGLTGEDYEDALRRQGGRCARCGSDNPGSGKRHFTILRRGHHRSGNIQLVCSPCAASLRQAQKSPYVRTEDGVQKICSQCGKLLPLEDFYRHINNKPTGACKQCIAASGQEASRWQKRRERRRRRNLRSYGLTEDQYLALLKKQGGGCAICGATEPGRKGDRNFCVDHDHRTGAMRGLLCHCCNQAIGHLKDSPDFCRKAANYLETSLQQMRNP